MHSLTALVGPPCSLPLGRPLPQRSAAAPGALGGRGCTLGGDTPHTPQVRAPCSTSLKHANLVKHSHTPDYLQRMHTAAREGTRLNLSTPCMLPLSDMNECKHPCIHKQSQSGALLLPSPVVSPQQVFMAPGSYHQDRWALAHTYQFFNAAIHSSSQQLAAISKVKMC